MPGATRNPGEWIEVLRSQGREIFYFLLWADWAFLREREAKRQKLNLQFCKLAYDLFVLADWKAFKERAKLDEIVLDARQQQDLCACVWTEARLDEQ